VTRYILDTNAVSAFINHLHGVDVRVREARARGARIGTCMPVVGELYYGLELSVTRDENIRRANAGLKQLVIWPFDLDAAKEFGRIRAHLRRVGRTMQIVDVQLAAVAFALGNCTVVTTDSDLSAVPGLRVENWSVPEA
jgi:tRNA(fMet)-specific endonuclease VapC